MKPANRFVSLFVTQTKRQEGNRIVPREPSRRNTQDALILNGELPNKWRAAFIWPEQIRNNAGEYALFRRTVALETLPDSLRLFVTADSRYRLFVNGQRVGRGPLKGTLNRYHFEEYEIAPFLHPGKNVLSVDVVWFGYNAPLSEEHSGYPGLLVQSTDGLFDTPGEWKTLVCPALTWDRTPYTSNAHLFLAGMEQWHLNQWPHNWQSPDFDDSSWPVAPVAFPLTAAGGDPERGLVWNFAPRDLPALWEEERHFAAPPAKENGLLTLAPNEAGEIVLDAGTLTTGYPQLFFAGGKGRTVEIVYAECYLQRTEKPDDGKPYRWGGGGRLQKAIRDDMTGLLHGYQDTLTLAGNVISWEPFHWRTFWYIKIRVSAGEEAFVLREATYRFTTAPQTQAATFESSEPDTALMMAISWRTLQLCSDETYEDCPGYEQLNYLYDARNESLLSLYLCNDVTLPKRTIRLFRETLRPDGMIASRTPSALRQTIPLFALWWIPMVADLYQWAGDSERAFVRDCLITVDAILSYFRARLRDDGLMGPLPYWNPVGGDDTPGTEVARAIREGGSTYATAVYLYALETACRLHDSVGYAEDSYRWTRIRARLKAAIQSQFVSERGVFAEMPGEESGPVSQHTQALAILAGAAEPAQVAGLVQAIEQNVPACKMTLQMGLPFAQAMRQVGRYDLAFAQYMSEYHAMLDLHLTTWLESTGPGVRSDCHAWSAWLPIEFLGTLLGIRPSLPGFRTITIRPTPVVASAEGTLSTPVGEIAVAGRNENGQFTIEGHVPVGIPVTIVLPDNTAEIQTNGGRFGISGRWQ